MTGCRSSDDAHFAKLFITLLESGFLSASGHTIDMGASCTPMLEVTDLKAVRGERQLFEGLAFELHPGEMLYVNGPNGGGKTTLLRMLCGLAMPEEGTVLWRGQTIQHLGDEYYRELFYFGHTNALKDDMTGVENLRYTLRLSGYPATEKEIARSLEQMGLAGYEDLPTKVLSQGQKRRAALARLLLTKAVLWILDEPFTALDTAAIDMLRQTIRRHLAQNGIVVMTTHQEVTIETSVIKQIRMGG